MARAMGAGRGEAPLHAHPSLPAVSSLRNGATPGAGRRGWVTCWGLTSIALPQACSGLCVSLMSWQWGGGVPSVWQV